MTFVKPGDRVVVTGATGFVGQTLVEHLAEAGYEVVGVSERPEPPPRISSCLSDYFCADLTHEWPKIGDFGGLVHLAGLAAVGPSFERPQQYLNTNSAMVTCLFEHVVEQDWLGRAIIVSSGSVYGSGPAGSDGVTEKCSVEVTSPYVISKLLTETQTEYYRSRGVDAVVVRPFNHIGPGQGPGFIVPDLVAKVRGLRSGAVLKAGNLESGRDYTDVRDVVRAYRLLLELERPSRTTYNVCSGSARSGREVLSAICTALNVSVPDVKAVSGRAIDPAVVVGNSGRLRSETSWQPTIGFEQSVIDYVASSSA